MNNMPVVRRGGNRKYYECVSIGGGSLQAMGQQGMVSVSMKLMIDTDAQTLTRDVEGRQEVMPLYSDSAFDLLSREWLRVGWNQRHSYNFSWMGRPVIQLPEDLIRIQEVIHRVQPDVIVETGVAHGGSLIFYATLCEAMHRGRIIGIDIEIRPANRAAIEGHPLAHRIDLLEGSSTDPSTLAAVRSRIRPGDTVLVLLDSDHSHAHVTAELALYAPLVTPGSYLVATDGIMGDLHDVPRGRPEWVTDNPTVAASEFAAQHPEFVLEQPAWPFRESTLSRNLTYWPGAYLRRV
jgi:cephalosporin hydroxylase